MSQALRWLLPVCILACWGCGRAQRAQSGLTPLTPQAGRATETSPPQCSARYCWPRQERTYEALIQRTPEPPGYHRVPLAEGTWAHWLRYLPVRAADTPVRTVEGAITVPGDASCLAAVIDLDVRRNQDCADVIMRLAAEYLRWKGRADSLAFAVNGGGSIAWAQWRQGVRPHLVGRRLEFSRTAAPDASRRSFDRYLASVFAWCGTVSLPLQTAPVAPQTLQVGDLFTRAGNPGHAVLVADLARDASGHRAALILQGYLPAQSAHVVKPDGDCCWISLDPARPIDIPRWGPFQWRDLRRFRVPRGL